MPWNAGRAGAPRKAGSVRSRTRNPSLVAPDRREQPWASPSWPRSAGLRLELADELRGEAPDLAAVEDVEVPQPLDLLSRKAPERDGQDVPAQPACHELPAPPRRPRRHQNHVALLRMQESARHQPIRCRACEIEPPILPDIGQ